MAECRNAAARLGCVGHLCLRAKAPGRRAHWAGARPKLRSGITKNNSRSLGSFLDLDQSLVYLSAIIRPDDGPEWAINMRISVTDAKGQLTDLVRRAEAGDEVVLTRHGHAAVRLVPVKRLPGLRDRRALLEAARASGRAKASEGVSAARSQDFLYDKDGLPE